jgi:succinate dehydrogenase / fumarate reductase, cytochrome b subunit
MSWITKALTSTLGRKLVMGLSGLFLVSFLFVHLFGNLLLFVPDHGISFNSFAHFMGHNPLIRILEIGLFAGFAIHIWTARLLTVRNQNARPVAYSYAQPAPEVTWFSRNMGTSGTIILLFLVLHLKNFYFLFKFGTDLPVVFMDGEEVTNYYLLVTEFFKNEWWYSVFYIPCMVLLGFHLNHGFQSAFRTLGVNHVKYTPLLVSISTALSWLFPVGFAAMPLYFMLK